MPSSREPADRSRHKRRLPLSERALVLFRRTAGKVPDLMTVPILLFCQESYRYSGRWLAVKPVQLGFWKTRRDNELIGGSALRILALFLVVTISLPCPGRLLAQAQVGQLNLVIIEGEGAIN